VTPLPAIPIGAIPVVTSPDQLERPIYAYLAKPSDVKTIQDAANVVTAQCMQSFGLPSMPTELDGFDDTAVRDLRSHTNLYGFFDPAVVSNKGYDMFRAPAAQTQHIPASGEKLSADGLGVQYGKDASGKPVQSFEGKTVPPGGCKAKGVEASGGTLPGLAPEDLPEGGPTIPYGDPRIIAVDAAWSNCMTSKGYHFANPFDAALAITADPPKSAAQITHTPAEIAQARADIDCKLSTNLMGTEFAVQVAYDKRYIDSHAVELTQYRTQLDDRVRKAAQTIATGGSAQ
jgi:hypothetical protein